MRKYYYYYVHTTKIFFLLFKDKQLFIKMEVKRNDKRIIRHIFNTWYEVVNESLTQKNH